MTTPHHALQLPAAQAGRIVDLLLAAETLLSALRARGERGNPAMLAHLEDLAGLLTGGGDARQLIGDLEAARLQLAALMLAASPQ